MWRYKGDPSPEPQDKLGSQRRVAQCERDGTVIKEWDSITEAAEGLGMNSSSHITSVCKGRRQTTGGWAWKYID